MRAVNCLVNPYNTLQGGRYYHLYLKAANLRYRIVRNWFKVALVVRGRAGLHVMQPVSLTPNWATRERAAVLESLPGPA